jgi:hypothetical protein
MLKPDNRAEIARRNGAMSKGPTSAAGKSRSSQNAVRHGLTATGTVVLRNENPETWQQVLAAHVERYNPVDGIEHDLVEDIAFCRWRMRRFRGVDSALWDLQMDEQSEQFAARYETADETIRLAFAFRSDANLSLASRYEGRLRRSYERAIRTFNDYRSESRNRKTTKRTDISTAESTKQLADLPSTNS